MADKLLKVKDVCVVVSVLGWQNGVKILSRLNDDLLYDILKNCYKEGFKYMCELILAIQNRPTLVERLLNCLTQD